MTRTEALLQWISRITLTSFEEMIKNGIRNEVHETTDEDKIQTHKHSNILRSVYISK